MLRWVCEGWDGLTCSDAPQQKMAHPPSAKLAIESGRAEFPLSAAAFLRIRNSVRLRRLRSRSGNRTKPSTGKPGAWRRRKVDSNLQRRYLGGLPYIRWNARAFYPGGQALPVFECDQNRGSD